MFTQQQMFTQQNTEGLTDTEIETMNAALRLRMARLADSEIEFDQLIKSESDAINNAWQPGALVSDLI